jgi:uncharacterized membrane protein
MELYPKNKIPLADVKKFIFIFYLVGLLGFMVPFTKTLFVQITSFALLLHSYLLAVYHSNYTFKDTFVFVLIFLLGYFIEVIGVKTGYIFGNYTYGNALGVKFLETPLMIGVNWLFLTYTATAITVGLKFNKWISLFVAPLFMLVYDIVLEQVAPKMNMWMWLNSEVPVRNYIAWYVIGFCFVLLLKVFKIETKNPLATILFISQFVFLTMLTFLL